MTQTLGVRMRDVARGNRVPGNSGKVKVCDSSARPRPRLYRKGSCEKHASTTKSKRSMKSLDAFGLDSDKCRRFRRPTTRFVERKKKIVSGSNFSNFDASRVGWMNC